MKSLQSDLLPFLEGESHLIALDSQQKILKILGAWYPHRGVVLRNNGTIQIPIIDIIIIIATYYVKDWKQIVIVANTGIF